MDLELRQRADEIVAGLARRSFTAIRPRVRKARDHWGKLGAIERFCDWSERAAVLWALLRADGLDLEDPGLWHALGEGLASATAQDVIKLLEGIGQIPSDAWMALGGWPWWLDRICAPRYVAAPEVFEEALPRCSRAIQRGFSTLMLRCGRTPLVAPDDEMLDAMVKVQVDGYGFGASSSGVSGTWLRLAWPAWEGERDGLDVNLWDQAREGFGETFYALIDLFTTREDWARRCLKLVEGRTYGIPLQRAQDAFRVAPVEVLAGLIRGMGDPEVRTWWIFDALRPDLDAEALLTLAGLLVGHSRPRAADVVACCALERGAAVEAVLPFMQFRGFETGYGSGYANFFENWERYRSVLRRLPPEVARQKIIDRLQEGGWQSEAALAFLAEHLDDAIWAVARQHLKDATSSHTALVHWKAAAHGLSLLGLEALPRLEALVDEAASAGQVGLRDAMAWALLETMARLAREGQGWEARWDRHLRFDLWKAGQDDYDFTHYILPVLTTAISALEPGRAEAVLRRGLDPALNPGWTRPFGVMRADTTPDGALDAAFEALCLHGTSARQGYANQIEQAMHSDRLGRRADPWVTRALSRGMPDVVANWLKSGMGEERWKAARPAEAVVEELPEEPVARLEVLAARLRARFPDAKCVPVVGLRVKDDEPPAPGDVSRAWGLPVGITRDRWPLGPDGAPMAHVMTVDLVALGVGPTRKPWSEARAAALFVHNPGYNEAWAPHNKSSAVLPLTDEQLALGPPDVEGWEALELCDEPIEADGARRLDVVTVMVPRGLGVGAEVDVRAMNAAIQNLPGSVPDYPDWIQDDEFPRREEFLFQFDERLGWLNLGDMGRMFVFTNTAFWQCH